MSGFNSRPRVAGDHMFSYVVAALEAFQFTPARGGRRGEDGRLRHAVLFQFTPARGGRLAALKRRVATAEFQFTPARGGRRRTWRR